MFYSFTNNRLQDFKAEKLFLEEELEKFEKLSHILYQPSAHSIFKSVFIVFIEYFCYAFVLLTLYILFKGHTIFPFTILSKINAEKEITQTLGSTNLLCLNLTLYGIGIFLGGIFFLLARLANQLRQKDETFLTVEQDIANIIEATENRIKYINETISNYNNENWEGKIESPLKPKKKDMVNDVANPGFGD